MKKSQLGQLWMPRARALKHGWGTNLLKREVVGPMRASEQRARETTRGRRSTRFQTWKINTNIYEVLRRNVLYFKSRGCLKSKRDSVIIRRTYLE